jgi:glycosyltransferase involved in cell wall biosynthesis
MMKITGIVLTNNEELNIRDCLESIKWVDELIVVDSESTDRTICIVKEFTNKIFSRHFSTITEKRKFALSQAGISNEWILFLDADERITDNLKNEIQSLQDNGITDGYYINRKNYYLGKWIRYCGIYPDHILRLFRKSKAGVTDRLIHEAIEVYGKTEKLKNDMLHFSFRDLDQMIDKINFFSTHEAQEHFQKNKKISKAGIFTHAASAFLRIFISRKGYKDGINGFYVAFSYSMVNFLSHLKLLKIQNKL